MGEIWYTDCGNTCPAAGKGVSLICVLEGLTKPMLNGKIEATCVKGKVKCEYK